MTKSERTGQKLPYRLSPHRHVDDRVEVIVKRKGAFFERVIFDPRKLRTREEYIQGLVDFASAINRSLARAQRADLSTGPTIEMDDDEAH